MRQTATIKNIEQLVRERIIGDALKQRVVVGCCSCSGCNVHVDQRSFFFHAFVSIGLV